MTSPDRRRFLKLSASAGAAAALSAVLPEAIAKAMAIAPDRRSGTLADVDHVVILMQENRSFDHYFGSLRGVRGFADPHPINLPSGKSVWYQPATANGSDYVLPFRPDASDLGMQFIEDLPHGWTDTHAAWNAGHYDRWVPAKGSTTMAYLTREDIPFHYALADAFTVCDAYHCSMLSSTDPNRYYMWTGYAGNDGEGGGPVIDNAELGYSWTTYPERLEQAGISWKIYQDVGDGLDAAGHWGWTSDAYIGNYGDNSLLYFNQFRNAQPGSALYEKARSGTEIKLSGGLLDQLQHDVRQRSLPQVSWLVAPEAYTEHPNWPANYGAWYIAQVLETLTADPVLWSRTVLLVTYDENDGFFDHVPPPFPPGSSSAPGQSTVSTEGEFYTPRAGSHYAAGHYGLGVRVPMIAISPWSRGGWVCSQVFDHTSIIRFLEQRFGVHEPHISPWRRAVCGDLTTAFDFGGVQPDHVALPATSQYAPPDQLRHENYRPKPPQVGQLPSQEPGVRLARSLPYAVAVDGQVESDGRLQLNFTNRGQAGVSLLVTSSERDDGPWSYTVEAGKQLSAQWETPHGASGYQLSVYGPNGFLREFAGSHPGAAPGRPRGEVRAQIGESSDQLRLTLINTGRSTAHFRVQPNAYSDEPARHYQVHSGGSVEDVWDISHSAHWYDLSVSIDADPNFLRRLAGHHETGRPSLSDPAMGRLRRDDPRLTIGEEQAVAQ
jgi:phospholipase C